MNDKSCDVRDGYLAHSPDAEWWEKCQRLADDLQTAVDRVNDVVIEARAAGLVVEIDDKGYRGEPWNRKQRGLLRATALAPLP